MTTPAFLKPDGFDQFRKGIGLSIVVFALAASGETEIDTDIDVTDPQTAAVTVAKELASALQARTIIDAGYRRWRANAMRDVLAADPKLAEWKAKAEVEAQPEFLEWKERLAEVEASVAFLESLRSVLLGGSLVAPSAD